MRSLLLAVSAMGVALMLSGAELPDPKTGGVNGAPMSILVLAGKHGMDSANMIDPQYEKMLADAGYRIAKTSLLSRLSPEYLKQFGAVVLTKLPYAGAEYSVNGQELVHVEGNLSLLQDYVAEGGGLLLEPALSEFGEAFADTYNRFLKPFDAKIIPQLLCHDSETKGAYAAGVISSPHEIAAGLKNILYPINVLRWDHAYATTPYVLGKEWIVLASGKPGSGTHQALANSKVGPQLTTTNNLFAIRPYKKGFIALSSIHSYYTLTLVFMKEDHIGENHTGVIDGIPMFGEKDGRPSDLAKLLDRSYRYLAANSAKNGIGGGNLELPPQDPAPTCEPVIDWHTAKPAPTWQHRVTGVPVGNKTYYDEHPDPLVPGELKYFKALIGARTALSDGAGTVREYREACVKAGYSAIMFAEPLEKMDIQKWGYLVQDCRDNSDDQFVCLPGLNIEDFQGGRYLVLGPERFPDPTWLTEDGKRLKAVRMLSLGWYGQLSSVHRAGSISLHPKMLKQYSGITVYTYDGKGRLVDDALHAYQWAVRSDSNPFPIVAHEVTSPDQVALASTTGFQQILPAPKLRGAVEYFRFGFPNYFQCPGRYFITEGPILDGWSIFNKDIGAPEENRDHYRMEIGVRSDVPVTDVTLYDGFEVAGRWFPGADVFKTMVDGFHDRQREYLLIATDQKGRRVLSPGIRTVCKNWRCRCGDRQNWLGSFWIYTGTILGSIGNYSLPFRNTREGGSRWINSGGGGGNPCPIFDYPYFGNHLKVEDADISTKYIDAGFEDVAFDAKPVYAVRPTDFTDASVRMWNFVPRRNVRIQGYDKFFNVALMEVDIRLKRDVEPAPDKPVWPEIAGAMAKNELLLVPGKPQAALPAKEPVELPVGSYVGGIIPLTPGLKLAWRSIGFPAPSQDVLNLYEGTTWKASYLVLKNSSFQYCTGQANFETDQFAARALNEMGFDGPPPYEFSMVQGKFEKLAYIADFRAENGGIAGTCKNDKGQELLYDVPLRISGLNPRCAAALWRSDTKYLDYFACFLDNGYVTLNADKTVDFYAGNVALCDPQLFVSVVIWNDKEAWFRVNNPLRRDITTDFATVPAVKGLKQLKTSVTVKGGTSVDVRSND